MPTAALDLLAEARGTASDACLVYVRTEADGVYDYDEGPIILDGYTCSAEFLGRTILYRTDHGTTLPVTRKEP